MKSLTVCLVAGVVLLAGCTAPAPQPPAKYNRSAVRPINPASSASSASPRTPQSNAPLQPIKQSSTSPELRDVATLTPPTDVWDRIRRGFKMPDLDNDLVRSREQWYAGRPEYIERMINRSNKYIFHIVEELERRNMPTELALLPYVESAFNPQAISSARATGMWQFMPATGSNYALKQNVFRDDRRDVIASTRAALDYLQRLYDMFGDWQLALAAYNWGEGNVSRAIAKNNRAGLPTTYSDLSMPGETRLYVPKLQALKNIVADPARFGTDLPMIPNHPYFDTVKLTRDLDVELAAKLADVRIEDFRALNPAAHKPVLLAAGTPEILLPWDNAAVFQRNFQAYSEGQYASWTAWVVPRTMTVADAAQSVGMREADLRALNKIPPQMKIKAGSTLIVPRSSRVHEDVNAAVADNGTLSFQPEVTTRRTVVRAGNHDSVASIARRYRLPATNVARWNDVNSNHVFTRGYMVVVYLPVYASHNARVGSGIRASAHGGKHSMQKTAQKKHHGAQPKKRKR